MLLVIKCSKANRTINAPNAFGGNDSSIVVRQACYKSRVHNLLPIAIDIESAAIFALL